MEEMERAERGVHARPGDPPNFFSAAGIETLLFDFETYSNSSTPSTDGDRIAELILVRVFDLIRSAAYVEIKKRPDSRLLLRDSFRENLPGGAGRLNPLLEKILSPGELDETLRELFLLLEHLREHFFSTVRSGRPECWESSLPSMWRGDSRCASYQRCWGKEAPREGVEKCHEFYSSWKDTKLSLPKRELLRTHPVELAGEVYECCGLLKFLTERPRLEEYLALSEAHSAGTHGKRRSVHGLVVRLLSMCADHCLGKLNCRLEPVTGEKWYFLAPVPDAPN